MIECGLNRPFIGSKATGVRHDRVPRNQPVLALPSGRDPWPAAAVAPCSGSARPTRIVSTPVFRCPLPHNVALRAFAETVPGNFGRRGSEPVPEAVDRRR